MNVGPCMSTPASPSEIPRATSRGAQRRGHRQVPAGQRLADAHDVRRDAGVVGGEQLAGPAEAGGDLVEDQQHVVGQAQLAQHVQVARVVEAHAAGALHHRLDDHRGQLVGVRLDQLAPARRRSACVERRPAAARRTPAAAARRATARACRRPGRRRSSRRRCRRGSRRARSSAGAWPAVPRDRWYCRHILIATSTETEPESARNTCSSPAGVISTSSRASSTAGPWVRPPNITWLIAPSWSRTAASSTGWR